MMSHPIFRNAVAITVMRQDGLLPFAETVQRLVSMMVNLQVRLQTTTQHTCNRVQQFNNIKSHDTTPQCLVSDNVVSYCVEMYHQITSLLVVLCLTVILYVILYTVQYYMLYQTTKKDPYHEEYAQNN